MSGNIEERLKEIIVKRLNVEASAVVPAAKFIDDLGADSLDIVELVMAMEEEFGVDIPDDDTENLRTVEEAINYIKKAEQS